MNIQIKAKAGVFNNDGSGFQNEDGIKKLNGAIAEEPFEIWDAEADLSAVSDGSIQLIYENDSNCFFVLSQFQAPAALSDFELTRLTDRTHGQWGDGAGVSAFCWFEDEFDARIDLIKYAIEETFVRQGEGAWRRFVVDEFVVD